MKRMLIASTARFTEDPRVAKQGDCELFGARRSKAKGPRSVLTGFDIALSILRCRPVTTSGATRFSWRGLKATTAIRLDLCSSVRRQEAASWHMC